MQPLMLGGESAQNREWIEEACAQPDGLFNSFYIQRYAHWRTGEEQINLELELNVLQDIEPPLEENKDQLTYLRDYDDSRG